MSEDSTQDFSEDTTQEKSKSKWNWRNVSAVFVLMAMTVVASVGANSYWNQKSDEEKVQEIASILSDGEFDTDLLLANLKGTDYLGAAGELVRPVSFSATTYYTLEQVLELTEQESFDDLPLDLKDRFNADGLLPVPVANAVTSGFLAGDMVIVPSRLFALNIPVQLATSTHVELRVHADDAVEDGWKQEILFIGTAADLFNSANAVFNSDYSIVFVKRPAERNLPEPSDFPFNVADINDISNLNIVVHGNSSTARTSTVTRVVADNGLFVITGAFTMQDAGSPVFVLRDGELVWAGVIVDFADQNRAIVVGAQVIKDLSGRR